MFISLVYFSYVIEETRFTGGIISMSFGETKFYHMCDLITESHYRFEALAGIIPVICAIEAGGGSTFVLDATFHQPAVVSK